MRAQRPLKRWIWICLVVALISLLLLYVGQYQSGLGVMRWLDGPLRSWVADGSLYATPLFAIATIVLAIVYRRRTHVTCTLGRSGEFLTIERASAAFVEAARALPPAVYMAPGGPLDVAYPSQEFSPGAPAPDTPPVDTPFSPPQPAAGKPWYMD